MAHASSPTARAAAGWQLREILRLQPRQILPLQDLPGDTLLCCEGCIWITLDHDRRDILLGPGDRLQWEPGRHGLVQAMEASSVRLLAGVPPSPRREHPRASRPGRLPIWSPFAQTA